MPEQQWNQEKQCWEPAEPLSDRPVKIAKIIGESARLFLIVWGVFWLCYAVAEWGSPF